jgi:lambda repressor-like predicted transcriptional regulator
MEPHAGATVEKAVRRSGISIAELSRRVDVNRRSIYNWFEQRNLNIETIAKIGYAIGYDFSHDFPDLLDSQKFTQMKSLVEPDIDILENITYWKNKYIFLLEKYNDLLLKQTSPSEEKKNNAA